MKKNNIFILLLAVMGIVSSCEDRIERLLPEDNTVNELVFSNEALAQGALIGVYNRAQQDNVLNGTFQFIQEWQADNVAFEGTFTTFQQISLYATLASNGTFFGVWDDHYEVIGAANLVIDNIPLIEDIGFTDAERSQAISEARFLRALAYFQLTVFFSQTIQAGGPGTLAVPLVLTSETGLEIPRATLGEVLTFVEQELTAIIPLLADGTRTRANPGVCQAFLARMFLYQDRFAEAADMANTVINDSFFALAPDYEFYDNPGSTEHIFTLVNDAVNGQTSGQGFSGLSNPTPEGRGDVPFTADLLAVFAEEPGDLRVAPESAPGADDGLVQIGNGAEGVPRTFTNKFPDGVTNAEQLHLTILMCFVQELDYLI